MNQNNTEKLVTHPKEYPLNLMTDFYKICEHTSSDTLYCMNEDQVMGLNAVLSTLDDRRRSIMILHYKHGKTYKDIAEKFNLSTERIRQLRDKAFRIINKPYNYALIKNGYIHTMNTFITVNAHYGINGNKPLTPDDSILELPFNNLRLSVRCLNALTRRNPCLKTIKDLIDLKPEDILRIRNLGIKSIKEINYELESLGIYNTAWSTIVGKDTFDELKKSLNE